MTAYISIEDPRRSVQSSFKNTSAGGALCFSCVGNLTVSSGTNHPLPPKTQYKTKKWMRVRRNEHCWVVSICLFRCHLCLALLHILTNWPLRIVSPLDSVGFSQLALAGLFQRVGGEHCFVLFVCLFFDSLCWAVTMFLPLSSWHLLNGSSPSVTDLSEFT